MALNVKYYYNTQTNEKSDSHQYYIGYIPLIHIRNNGKELIQKSGRNSMIEEVKDF
jgi:hypothetical protein